MRNVVFALPGMKYFADGIAEILGWEKMIGGYVGDCDTCLIVGMYDPPYYATTLKMTQRAKRRIIQWCGTDVLNYQPDWGTLPFAEHIAESESLHDELFAKGIESTTLTLPAFHHFPVTPLPEKKMVVCYLGNNPLAYGNDMFASLGELMGEQADFIGYMHGQYDYKGMAEMCSDSSLYLRLTEHDGGCMSAREFLEAGRPVIASSKLPFAVQVRHDDIVGLVREVRKALAIKEPNLLAHEFYKRFNSNERYLAEMKGVLGDV